MTAKFKDPALQQMYEKCRALAAARHEELFHEGRPRRGAGHKNAYWNGRAGLANRLWSRNSLAYAAYAAGRDDMRQFGVLT